MSYFTPVKWLTEEGPRQAKLQGDLEVLVLALRDEYGWSAGEIADLFEWAIDRAQDEAA